LHPSSLLGSVLDVLLRGGIDVEGLAFAWARTMPAITLVPAFGLRALPAPARVLAGLALAVCVSPAIVVAPASPATTETAVVRLFAEVARGLPVAIAAAVPLWAATMAGNVADALRSATDASSLPAVEGRAGPMGVLFSLLASSMFLAGGGPSRAAMALAVQPAPHEPLLAAAADVTGGITLAVAVGAPLLAAGTIVEIAAALIARAAAPAQVHLLLAPLRALATLLVTGLVFDRLAAVLARSVGAAP
jgi:type III secretory pathway component EscT